MHSWKVDREIHRSGERTHYAPREGGKRRYMAGLDELRALAVLAVIGYHLSPAWLPGGFLGVGLFFTLSGYLVTDLIVQEWDTRGGFDLKRFWIRRARRLLPAMLGVLVVIVIISLLFDPTRKTALQGDVPAALLYMNNWWFIVRDVSYFESFGPASPLGHFWSLAIEEQFYLLWPLLLLPGLRYLSRLRLAGWTLALAVVSAVWMAVLYVPGADPSRAYYGTDTRIFAILIGAALAMVWPSAKLKRGATPKARRALDAAGIIGLLLVGVACLKLNEYQPFLYRGGFFLLALVSAVLIAVLAHPENRIGNRKAAGWLRLIGKRSYGLYLWHYPILVLTTPLTAAGELSIRRVLLQLTATFVLAELSWRFIEKPIRELGFRSWLRQLRRTLIARPLWGRGFAAAVFLAVLLFCAGTVGLYAAGPSATGGFTALPTPTWPANGAVSPTGPGGGTAGEIPVAGQSPDPDGASHPAAAETAAVGATGLTEGVATPAAAVSTPRPTGSSATSPVPSAQLVTAEPPAGESGGDKDAHNPDGAATEPIPSSGQEGGDQVTGSGADNTAPEATPQQEPPAITAIGDSVMLDIQPYMESDIAGIVVSGKVGRQMADAPEIIGELKREGKLGHTVILELGTNGAFTRKQMKRMLDELDEVRHIVLVNARVPRAWEQTVNKALENAAEDDQRITLVDWHRASAGKHDYFAADGVHLTSIGAEAYTSLLKQTLEGL